MKKFRLIALAIVCILSTACFFACKDDESSSQGTPSHTCEFGAWELVTEATCFVDGEEKRTCIVEGCTAGDDAVSAKVEYRAIPKGHKFNANGVCTVCGYDPANSYTYKTYTSVSPSNWNELTYQDNNDTQIMGYLGSAFFEADFKYDENGEIVPGEFVTEYSFATKIEDVTAAMAEDWGYSAKQVAAGGYAWKITIRNDGKWENGDPIVAGDFVYTMKEQLNPLFRNYRADSFYAGSVNLIGAKEYAFQGSEGVFQALTLLSPSAYDSEVHDSKLIFSLANPSANEKIYGTASECYMRTNFGFPDSYDAAACAKYLKDNYIEDLDLAVVASMEGKTLAAIKDDEAMAAQWNLLWGETFWGAVPGEEVHFCIMEGAFPEVSFDTVGIFAPSDTEIVVCLLDPINVLNADGSLTYHAFYEFSSLPLVHEATYEACKVAPETEGGLWTSKYNSSLETTMSWGPYKLTAFQAGKFYALEKNGTWFGYQEGSKYEGQYQTTRIECETITSYNTAFLKFLDGDLTGIGIDVSKAAEYKTSSRAYFTPDDFVGSMQLQSNKEALKAREKAGINKSLLSYQDFRKAISLSFHRDDYNTTCTTSSKAGYGIFNSMHYYDVANGGVYRNTDVAKQVLCNVYGLDVEEYDSLDDAYDAITGYDMDQAKALLEKAYAEALAAGDIKEGDTVLLTVGTAVDTESTRRVFEFIKGSLEKLAEDTVLAGKLTAEFNTSYGDNWANDFRAGAYDICTGGWTGAAWDPGYFLMAYLSPQYMYSQGWDTAHHNVTMTVHGVKKIVNEETGAYAYEVTNNAEDSFTDTMPVYGGKASGSYNTNWYQLLNVEFGQGELAEEFRLEMIGAIEEVILTQYYSVPISYSFGASLISYQVDYITYEYNTFNAYGGIQYMTYHYNDAAWAAYVKGLEGGLDYTK